MLIIILRTFIVFICIVGAMRLMGKRQLGQLELSELVVAVLISDMAAHPLQDIGIPLLNGLLPIFVLFCCELLITWLALKSDTFRYAIFGKPSTLIRSGSIRQTEMLRNRFSLDELCEELRKQGVTDIASVLSAILETDGTLNVILRAQDRPVTPSVLGVAAEERGIPITLISDGKAARDNLRMLGRDEAWLLEQLRAHGYQSVSEVYYMNMDEKDGVFIAGKENP